MKALRPALRYRGGKARDARWIIAHLPPHECYVEPFMGGCNVLLQKPPVDFEVVNDLEGGVVNFFKVLRDKPDELRRAIAFTPYSREEYQECRKPDPSDPVEWARRVFVMCWQGRGRALGDNGGWRFQCAWNGWNAHVLRQFRDIERFQEISARLLHTQIEKGDAFEVIARWDRPQTLFYCDPPYVKSTRLKSGKLYENEMDDATHRKLSELLHSLTGMVVLSGYESPLYAELYSDWKVVTKKSWTEACKQSVEGLWINPAAWSAL